MNGNDKRLDIYVHFPDFSISSILKLLHGIDGKLTAANQKLEQLKMTIQEAIDTLAAENVKLDDISSKLTEGFTEISDLLHQLQNTTLTPEQEAIVTAAVAKVDAIQPQAQQIADIVPGP
jgi:predicted  nucleic acid-binding Zn-ribbon protein